MKHHNLKSFTYQFEMIVQGEMRAMVRLNDRDYQKDDTVTLHEGFPGVDGYQYTGKTISAKISCVDNFGCQQGYVNLSLSDVGLLIVEDDAAKK